MTDDAKITAYFEAKDAVHEIFGYKPDWVEIPLEDERGRHWMLVGGEGSGGVVVYANEPLTVELFKSEPPRDFYSAQIYTQRFLPKFVWRAERHVMVSVDTRTDGNRFLMLFDAAKECADEAVREAYGEW